MNGSLNSSKTRQRLPVLDALRGLAAVGVALVHFTIEMHATWFQQVCHWGWLGVDVFFVISGFVIPLSLVGTGYHFTSGYLRFLSKRLVRLHPPYLATVLVLMGISIYHSSTSLLEIAKVFASHALLLNGLINEPWLSGVFWSLAIEMQFYLFIGIVAPLQAPSNYPESSFFCRFNSHGSRMRFCDG